MKRTVLDVIPNRGDNEHVPPEFVSALDYTYVRDFAYPKFHYLHYGVKLEQDDDYDDDEEEILDDDEYLEDNELTVNHNYNNNYSNYNNYYRTPAGGQGDIPDYDDTILTDKYTPDAGPPWQTQTSRYRNHGNRYNNSEAGGTFNDRNGYDDEYNDRNGNNRNYGEEEGYEEGDEDFDDDDDNGYYSSVDEIHCRAIALFDFEPENDNEYRLTAGHMVWISYRHGQGWLVAEDAVTGETGLVPEEYVKLETDLSPDDLAQLERLNLGEVSDKVNQPIELKQEDNKHQSDDIPSPTIEAAATSSSS